MPARLPEVLKIEAAPFTNATTGLLGITSDNAIASFLLGEVGSASAGFYSLPLFNPVAKACGFFAGDIWKATQKLSLTARPALGRVHASVEEKRQNFVLRSKPVGIQAPAVVRAGSHSPLSRKFLFSRCEHHAGKRYSEAIPYFKKSIAANPGDPRARFALGVAEFANQDYEAAKRGLAQIAERKDLILRTIKVIR